MERADSANTSETDTNEFNEQMSGVEQTTGDSKQRKVNEIDEQTTMIGSGTLQVINLISLGLESSTVVTSPSRIETKRRPSLLCIDSIITLTILPVDPNPKPYYNPSILALSIFKNNMVF